MRPDWHPDPTGRHELRYHNGVAWTGDVADDGRRSVDLGPVPPHATNGPGGAPPGNGMAVAALSCGVLALAFGWVPVLFVVGAVLAVLALVFGFVGLGRAREVGRGRPMAIAGLVTGAIGIVVAIGGLVFTVVVFRAVERYRDPAPHTVELTACTVDDGRVVATGTLRNDDTDAASFTVRVDLVRPGSGLLVEQMRTRVDDVAPGEGATWSVARRVDTDAVDCRVGEVTGPAPFGVLPP